MVNIPTGENSACVTPEVAQIFTQPDRLLSGEMVQRNVPHLCNTRDRRSKALGSKAGASSSLNLRAIRAANTKRT